MAAGVGKTIYDGDLIEQVYERHNHLIRTSRTLLHEHLMRVTQDIQQLSIISGIKNYLDTPSSQNLEVLERTLLDTSNVYGRYDQIRVIDLTGQEVVRVNHTHFGKKPRLSVHLSLGFLWVCFRRSL